MDTTVQSYDTASIRNNDKHRKIFCRIWLNAYINAQKRQNTQNRLRAIVKRIKDVDSIEEWTNSEEELAEDDRLDLILIGRLDRKLMSSIHQFRRHSTTNNNSEDNDNDNKCGCEFSKLKGVNVKLDQFISGINQQHKSRWEIEEPLSINMFTTSAEAGQSTTEINGQFVFSQVLIDCLLRLKVNEADKKELISCFEKEYQDNQVELVRICEFQQKYSRDKALWWYTRESFFYKTLNTALRKQDIHMMFLYRSYISDIHHQLQDYQTRSSVRVYRSQLMSTTELVNLRHNIGQFISVNSFFSTTKNRKVADAFMADKAEQTNLERIRFEIEADSKVTRSKPFADISNYSHFFDESEVLFMLGSIFHLKSIDRDNETQVWIIRMSLCGDNEHSLTPVLKQMQKENGTRTTNLCTLGQMLRNMGKPDLAKNYYERCINELSKNDPLLLTVYKDLADMASQKNDYEESMQWHQKLKQLKDAKKGNKCLQAFMFGCICLIAVVLGFCIYLMYVPKAMVKYGLPHGGADGVPFDDSVDLKLSSTAYCVGVQLFWKPDYLVAIRFIYQQGPSHVSKVRGDPGDPNEYISSLLNETLIMHDGETITKVTWYVGPNTWLFENDSGIRCVLGIQLYTSAGRVSRIYGSNKGEEYSESNEGYRFGYARGRSELLVNMLQFVWYHRRTFPYTRESITTAGPTTPILSPSTILPVVRYGSTCGGREGVAFNDAIDLELTSMASCIGVEVFWNRHFLVAIRFIYEEDGKNSLSIRKVYHGGQGELSQLIHAYSLFNETFMMNYTWERIDKITLYNGTHQLVGDNLKRFVLGIEFYTNAGRMSRLYGSRTKNKYVESYEGFTLGYVKGRSGHYVNMLHFVWYNHSTLTVKGYENFSASCPTSSSFFIHSAIYVDKSNASCSKNITDIVLEKCSNKETCSFSVSNDVFKYDSCSKNRTEVQLTYTCTVRRREQFGSVLVNMDHPGNDISINDRTDIDNIESLEACGKRCLVERHCVGVVYAPKGRLCWLKHMMGASQPTNDRNSMTLLVND